MADDALHGGSRTLQNGASDAPREGVVDALYVLFRYPQRSQTFVRDEVAALRDAGGRVDVLSLDPGEAGLAPGWAGPHAELGRPPLSRALLDHLWFLARHPRRYGRFLARVTTLRGRSRKSLVRLPTDARARLGAPHPPPRVHTHFAWSSASVALHLAALLDVPASITLHAKDIYTAQGAPLRRRLAGFDRVITVCQYNVGYLTGMGAVPAADPRVAVVPCGVELGPVAASPQVDVLAVGRLVPKKGFDVLVEALARVPAARLDLVGEGPERERLEALVARLGLGERVRFLGALDHADVLERMGAARVLCLPARLAADGDSDAMPVVLREAMARGVPVVASALAGIPESVDEEVGWLVAPEDVGGLAAALAEALGDEDERARRGTAARARVAARWTLERQAAQLATLL